MTFIKELSAEEKRRSCRFYNRRSNSCNQYKILACNHCVKYESKWEKI